MSAIATFHTELRDAELIAAALQQMGFLNVLNQAGQRILSRAVDISAHHPSGNHWQDVGFQKRADGTYTAVTDGDFYNAAWIGKLSQEYKIAQRMRSCQRQGLVFAGRTVQQTEKGERVQLRFFQR